MDESAQQAVQLGVNTTIFVVALTIGINLLLGVRNVADVAAEYNASIPSGSRVVTVQSNKTRIISGYELLSYYTNYMTDVNGERSYKYIITIEDVGKITKEDEETFEFEQAILKQYFHNKNINLNKEYEVVTERYDDDDEILNITLRAID